MSAVIGWDVGGANIKAARLDDPSARPIVLERAFALWREPARLAEVVAGIARELGPAPMNAVTMTAELADCFRSKAEGVRHVLDALEQALGASGLRIYGTDGRFRSADAARERPLDVAAANWHAAACLVARSIPDGILVDVGSTTTDIIPLTGGSVAALGRTDTERLRTGELVYTGVLRTPICAILRRVRLSSGWCRVAAEHFAIAADAHVWLERIPPGAYTCETPDGRGTSREEIAARLARVVCADPCLLDAADIARIARQVVAAQRRAIAAGIGQVAQRSGVPGPILACGLGERLAREAARAADLRARPLAAVWGADAARAAPAAAVAALLWEAIS